MKKIKIHTRTYMLLRYSVALMLGGVFIVVALIAAPPKKSYAQAQSCGSIPTDQPGTSSEVGTICSGTCPEGQRLQFTKAGDTECVVASSNNKCGNDLSHHAVTVSFNFGCRGNAYTKGPLNPIMDIMYAIFRFLSAGVGLVVIGSIIVAGIQYTGSRGNPQATEAAIKRITNALIGLLIYIFMFAILNFIVPGGMFI